MSLLYNTVIIDGYAYDTTPTLIQPELDLASSGVVHLTLGNNLQHMTYTSPTNGSRKIVKRAWTVEWDMMDISMYNKLLQIHTNGDVVLFRYDNAFSREAAIMESSDRQTFYTPTWPIKPYDYDDGEDTYINSIYLANNVTGEVIQYTGSEYTVNESTGSITFDFRIAEYVDVLIRYVSLMQVKIAEQSLEPIELAQTVYRGSILLEETHITLTDPLTQLAPDVELGTYTQEPEPSGIFIA